MEADLGSILAILENILTNRLMARLGVEQSPPHLLKLGRCARMNATVMEPEREQAARSLALALVVRTLS